MLKKEIQDIFSSNFNADTMEIVNKIKTKKAIEIIRFILELEESLGYYRNKKFFLDYDIFKRDNISFLTISFLIVERRTTYFNLYKKYANDMNKFVELYNDSYFCCKKNNSKKLKKYKLDKETIFDLEENSNEYSEYEIELSEYIKISLPNNKSDLNIINKIISSLSSIKNYN